MLSLVNYDGYNNYIQFHNSCAYLFIYIKLRSHCKHTVYIRTSATLNARSNLTGLYKTQLDFQHAAVHSTAHTESIADYNYTVAQPLLLYNSVCMFT